MNSEVNSDDEVREWRRGPIASALARVTDQKELMCSHDHNAYDESQNLWR